MDFDPILPFMQVISKARHQDIISPQMIFCSKWGVKTLELQVL